MQKMHYVTAHPIMETDLCASFRFELFTVIVIQGSKLNKKKKKNLENELMLYFRC